MAICVVLAKWVFLYFMYKKESSPESLSYKFTKFTITLKVKKYIKMRDINEAVECMLKNDVKYRFVIDTRS